MLNNWTVKIYLLKNKLYVQFNIIEIKHWADCIDNNCLNSKNNKYLNFKNANLKSDMPFAINKFEKRLIFYFIGEGIPQTKDII